ncbi:inositol polyphosphate-4-phosphatase type I A isoform X2 [Scaptodrosophila lebanonensis]|uniref:phosphatidylinositol-3,4-bisphosphate 4-phosphatase n=1 Tax=Drosophila lebanonensis TaxID=7225 RepID=A0A6J2TXK6_DROLE|nr:inositol polyphosphate-4-phosphatase type I A isoform X2 [Scaptodrosophila lebanonensis]
MHFNETEVEALANNPKTRFDKEGHLLIRERQSRQRQFFGDNYVTNLRWCKLRGNLLFYLKEADCNSPVGGLIVLENCSPIILRKEPDPDIGYEIVLNFQGCEPLRIGAKNAEEREDWIRRIENSSYKSLNSQIIALENQIAAASASADDALLLNAAPPLTSGPAMSKWLEDEQLPPLPPKQKSKDQQRQMPFNEDLSELPICETALSCDNLPLDLQNRAPNARIICSVLHPDQGYIWRPHARTEIIERSCSPQFLCTMRFRRTAGFTAQTRLRFTVYDVRERLSATSLPIGSATMTLGVFQDATRFRIPLRSTRGECGFLTLASWAPDCLGSGTCSNDAATSVVTAAAAPPRSITQVFEHGSTRDRAGHRRSHSLPPKLGAGSCIPLQCGLQRVCTNPRLRTYRLQSTLGADIRVQETLMESRLCFSVPQQLLSIWIQCEKELLQEISGMGELSGDWRLRQITLLEEHLRLLKDYSQAKQTIQQVMRDGDGMSFKRSTDKNDESLEFLPVNLHLQRMWVRNDTLQHTGVLDVVTVGAFTRHDGQGRGGLIKLLQESKAWKLGQGNACKVQAANDAVQAAKQLRKEIVELMSQLLNLAKCKSVKGMMPLCNAMIEKSKSLLNIWEPIIVEEAVNFIEQHRIIEEPDNVLMEPLSPFREITQQLNALDLKSPELEDFATPVVAPPDLWPHTSRNTSTSGFVLMRSNSWHPSPSPSTALDINTIDSLQQVVQCYSKHLRSLNPVQASSTCRPKKAEAGISKATYQSLPVDCQESEPQQQLLLIDLDEKPSIPTVAPLQPLTAADFLDTQIMTSSPSANYYRPTEEPEPLELTQLNIKASVMCLVSKIKFFCGRCDSPAIRLRHPKQHLKREGFATSPQHQKQQKPPDVVTTPQTQQLTLDLTPSQPQYPVPNKMVNKFTDGLDLSLTTDWASELRPSMRKLRHAMDRLLKTTRLMHSVQRLQQDMRSNSVHADIMYRRDVCFSQALTALVSALMVKFWATELNANYFHLLRDLGPLAYFEGLLSLHGGEADMWSDMCVAIEDLSSVNFTLIRAQLSSDTSVPMPRITGSRQSLEVLLPVPEHLYNIGLLSTTQPPLTFKITPVFFNIGIDAKATVAETLGQTRGQHRSNWDNFLRLNEYFIRYSKLPFQAPDTPSKLETAAVTPKSRQTLQTLLNAMKTHVCAKVSKNVKVLHLAEDVCRQLCGMRFTSCKSAKDRTGMAVTLEQGRVLKREFQLPLEHVPHVVNTMRSEGTRMDNVEKNIGKRKYAFNVLQVRALPDIYRPPLGTYGKAET